MNISRDQAKVIRDLLVSTQSQELNCNELLDKIGEYVEVEKSGETLSLELEMVKQHLSLCRECEEEYQALVTALGHFVGEDLGED